MNIVITGGSKGIGKSLALKFAKHNHNIFICARNEEALAATAIEIEKKTNGNLVAYFTADVSDQNSADKFSSWLGNKNIVADVLINNAGQFIPGSIYKEEDGLLEKMMAANLYSAYNITRALLPAMLEKKAGHIFNMCSIASLQAYSNGGAYSISKYALMGFSKNLREEMKPHNIKVTTVYPGAVYTASWEGSGVQPSRIMEVNDITEMIYAASLLSPQACVEDIVMRPQQGDLL